MRELIKRHDVDTVWFGAAAPLALMAPLARDAGGRWLDREVVEDGNWVTSRQPTDIPAFNRAMIGLFSRSLAASHP